MSRKLPLAFTLITRPPIITCIFLQCFSKAVFLVFDLNQRTAINKIVKLAISLKDDIKLRSTDRDKCFNALTGREYTVV